MCSVDLKTASIRGVEQYLWCNLVGRATDGGGGRGVGTVLKLTARDYRTAPGPSLASKESGTGRSQQIKSPSLTYQPRQFISDMANSSLSSPPGTHGR
jgi:hypothetical protein